MTPDQFYRILSDAVATNQWDLVVEILGELPVEPSIIREPQDPELTNAIFEQLLSSDDLANFQFKNLRLVQIIDRTTQLADLDQKVATDLGDYRDVYVTSLVLEFDQPIGQIRQISTPDHNQVVWLNGQVQIVGRQYRMSPTKLLQFTYYQGLLDIQPINSTHGHQLETAVKTIQVIDSFPTDGRGSPSMLAVALNGVLADYRSNGLVSDAVQEYVRKALSSDAGLWIRIY